MSINIYSRLKFLVPQLIPNSCQVGSLSKAGGEKTNDLFSLFVYDQGLRIIKGTENREQRIRISTYQKSCIVEYTVSDRLKFFFFVPCSFYCAELLIMKILGIRRDRQPFEYMKGTCSFISHFCLFFATMMGCVQNYYGYIEMFFYFCLTFMNNKDKMTSRCIQTMILNAAQYDDLFN